MWVGLTDGDTLGLLLKGREGCMLGAMLLEGAVDTGANWDDDVGFSCDDRFRTDTVTLTMTAKKTKRHKNRLPNLACLLLRDRAALS